MDDLTNSTLKLLQDLNELIQYFNVRSECAQCDFFNPDGIDGITVANKFYCFACIPKEKLDLVYDHLNVKKDHLKEMQKNLFKEV